MVDSGDLENGIAAQHLGHSNLDREWVLLGVCYGAAPSRKPVGAEQREQVGRGGLGGYFRQGRGGEKKRLEIEWQVGVGGNGEIGIENLVEESGVGVARWVAEGERGGQGFDEVRVEVLGLVTIFEDEVLEEGVCGKWVRQEVGGEEG